MKKLVDPIRAKKLPMTYFGEENPEVCWELLSFVYGESEIDPVFIELDDPDTEDLWGQKHRMQMEPLLLSVEGEIIFPMKHLFDTDMFILNYRQFYR